MPDGHARSWNQEATALRERLGRSFATGRTHDLNWRRTQLRALADWLRGDGGERVLAALQSDLGKPAMEGYGTESGFLLADIRHTLDHLDAWAAPRKVPGALVNLPSKTVIRYQPKGVALIIAPWNYPVQLALSPLVAALGAGCCAVVKPSELAPASSALLAEALPKVLDPDAVAVFEGPVEASTALLAQPWDHLLFTGSTRVGKIVMRAAAEHLTPVTLELGGKSPTIVCDDADIALAARRIAWGKFMNAGQTCIAPDYVLVDRKVQDRFLHEISATLQRFYGDDPQQSPDFARVVSADHHARLVGLLGGGRAAVGGQHDVTDRYLAPTILVDVDLDAAVMQEEIFGPILPVIPIDGIDAAIDFVQQRPRPLALYAFTSNHNRADALLSRTISGGACVNDVISHIAALELPFGGVGPSGMGAYHGEHGFQTFSHARGIVERYAFADAPIRYPPYEGNLRWIKMLMR
ncbi:MAG: aldehyde dehydrogenase family protein [Deltaproteobacteria bacterium]|nr:aldehyde dehydrogenase family protein [Deltaproteobacteria bacterium]